MPHVPQQAGLAAMLAPDAARVLLDCLSGMRDQFSFARLAQAGISAGWRCLVVNAGNGGVARWLSEAVTPRGTVIATSATPEYVLRHKRVTVATPDFELATLARGPFDLIHARLPVAGHWTPGEIVAALADRLAPGGALVIEAWDRQPGVLLSSPGPAAVVAYQRYQAALHELSASDCHPDSLAVGLPEVFMRAGLVGVDVALHARSWAGGTPGTKVHVVLLDALHDRLVAVGMPAAELHRLRQLLADPQALVLGRPVFSTVGRRRHAPAAWGAER